MIAKVHNVKFSIDTSDWVNSDDAQECADRIEYALMSLTEKEAQSLHAGLKSEDEWFIEQAHRIASRCASEILNGYEEQPESGHNYFIMAA